MEVYIDLQCIFKIWSVLCKQKCILTPNFPLKQKMVSGVGKDTFSFIIISQEFSMKKGSTQILW